MLVTAFDDFELPKVRVSVMSSLLGIGIFTLNGTSWSRARSVLKPSLARSKMDALPGILDKHFGAFMRHVSPTTTTETAARTATRTIIDLQPLFFAITMDVATEFLFGRSTGMLDSDKGTNEYDKQFLDDYMFCSEEAVKRMRMGPLSRFQYSKPANEAKRRVFAYVDKYIEESLARNARRGSAISDNNVLTELADAIGDRKLLRDQVLHILLASRDTTASLLSNLFFVLARKPDMYQRLRQEVVNALGSGQPTFAQLKDMTYLKWCVNESLRLHPVIPSNAREAVRDAVLPHGGGPDGESPLLVPKGTVVIYNFYSMHRDESVFGPRPEEFDPERWDGLRPGWNFLPFNGGPRACIGQQFALLESHYIIARLVQAFASMTSRDETEEWMELSALAMTCRNGVEVSLHRASS
ncbi:hypothetical protein N3K66_008886 [Trichothecium roseum]|uniref:Uncharacterized protein n=1 Tax=Trichothecium roseum TaxID=47278 RepID=A0ACC0UT89_9HYPO|nr:hypothetical protein N3K66_008886 [Trichothecium roseum]